MAPDAANPLAEATTLTATTADQPTAPHQIKAQFTTITAAAPQTGSLVIKRKNGLLDGRWKVKEAEGTSRRGIGLVANGRLWFARIAEAAEDLIGVVHYTLEDGNLRALWSVADKGGPVRGLCYGIGTRVQGAPDGFTGEFNVAYTNEKGGLEDPFTLTIGRHGPLDVLTWSSEGKVVFRGIGLTRGGTLGGAWLRGETVPDSVEIAVFPQALAAAAAAQGEWAGATGLRQSEPTRPELVFGASAK